MLVLFVASGFRKADGPKPKEDDMGGLAKKPTQTAPHGGTIYPVHHTEDLSVSKGYPFLPKPKL